MSEREREQVYSELAVMVDAGLPLGQALGVLTKQGSETAEAMASQVASGGPLSGAIQDRFERGVMEAFEEMGALDSGFSLLEEVLQERRILRSELTARMVYPIVLTHIAILLPPVVSAVNEGPPAYFKIVLPALALLWGALLSFRRFPGVARAVPVVGAAAADLSRARFLQVLGALWDAGIPPARALELAAEAAGDRSLRVPWVPGQPVAAALAASGRFSRAEVSAAEVGEVSGRVGDSLRSAAAVIDAQARSRLKVATTLAPVAAFLVAGLVIGVVVIRFWAKFYG